MRVRLFALGLAIVLAGTAAKPRDFPPLPVGEGRADFVFGKGPPSSYWIGVAGRFDEVRYSVADNPPECFLKSEAKLGSGRPHLEAIRIRSGRPHLIEGALRHSRPDGAYRKVTTCRAAVYFTPIDGHTYNFAMLAPTPDGNCRLDVIDDGTGSPPPDLLFDHYAFDACYQLGRFKPVSEPTDSD